MIRFGDVGVDTPYGECFLDGGGGLLLGVGGGD